MLRDWLPKYLRLKDNEVTPAVLQDFVDGIENEYNTMSSLIDDLKELISPDDTLYKGYLMNLIGGDKFRYSDISNWITKNIVYLHKIKGTEQSWKKYWYWLLNESNINVIELYKTEIYETTDWNYQKDNTYPIKSSKIQLCALSCETYDETLDAGWEEDYFDIVESVNPIHVRLRPNVNSNTYSNKVEDPSDDLGCFRCETTCESSCENGIEIWDGSSVTGDLDDIINNASDEILVTVTCVAICEMSCENCCETACECDACEIFCETACEVNRTHGPDPQGGGGCDTDCELECQGGCEELCMTDCEQACQFTCEDLCENACTLVCQYSCELSCESQYCEACTCQCAHTS